MIYDTYNDICNQIDIVKVAIENYKEQIAFLGKLAKINGPTPLQGMNYASTPVKSSGGIGYIEYLGKVEKIENHILLHQEHLKYLVSCKERIEYSLKKLEGKEKKVYYKKIVEGKTTEKISEEIGISDRQVQRIVKKLKEMHECRGNVV